MRHAKPFQRIASPKKNASSKSKVRKGKPNFLPPQNFSWPSTSVNVGSSNSPNKKSTWGTKESPTAGTISKKENNDSPKGENRSKIPLQMIRGLNVPAIYPSQYVKEAMDWVPRAEDVIIVTYGEAIREWLKCIVLKISSCGHNHIFMYHDHTFKMVPLIEKTGTRVVDCLYEPRIYMHHLPYDKVKKQKGARYIYMYPNPLNAFSIVYHTECRATGKWQNVNQVLDRFLKGDDMPYGSYYNHIMSYVKAAENDKDILLVSFENLVSHPSEEILKIAMFINEEFYFYLLVGGEALKDLENYANAMYVKLISNLSAQDPPLRKNFQEYDCSQLEIFGEGRRLLSDEQQRRLREMSLEGLKGTFLVQEWYCPPKLTSEKLTPFDSLLF